MRDVILEVKDLKKTFRAKNGMEVRAVNGISFTVERGEIFGFLGPNGAGKSTTITMLTTGLRADGGEILLDGRSVIRYPEEARAKIGVVTQHNCDLPEEFPVCQHPRWGTMQWDPVQPD